MRLILCSMACGIAGHLPGVDAWPGQTTAQAAAATGQLLAALDPDLAWEMSGAHWNPLTRTLWVTAGGADGKGTWALRYDAAGDAFSVVGFWPGPRDEDLTQVSFAPVAADRHRIYVLKEASFQIMQALMMVHAQGNGESVIERIWTIPEIAPAGARGAEGLVFVPDAWLTINGFVDGDGSPHTSRGGLGGLMFVAHQDGGYLYAIDLSADGTSRFSGRNYQVVGIYRTGLDESSALAFDRSIGRLYISHNIAGNRIEVTDLTSIAIHGDAKARRAMTPLAMMASPSLRNPEGFACTPYLADDGSVNTQRWAFFANDCERGDPPADQARSVVWYRDFQPETGTGMVLVRGAGPAQSVRVGTAVAIPPMVWARDARGYPLAGRTVSFIPDAGSVGAVTAVTDVLGRAGCGAWILGEQAGSRSLVARMAGAADVVFSATATAGPAATLRKAVGDDQRAAAGTALALMPGIAVGDAFGNPVSDVAVAFTVVDGGGLIDIAQASTAADGCAGPGVWTLGPRAGGNHLQASVAGLPPVSFTATGIDVTPPAAITDLTVVTTGTTSATLSWTAPGDDGATGTAAAYDLRFGTAMIDGADFPSAAQVGGEPAPAGAGGRQTMTVTGLAASTTYYFALIAIDGAGNAGAMSNVPSTTTAASPSADGGGRCGLGAMVAILAGLSLLLHRHIPRRR